MESRTLIRNSDDLVWEATWEGCDVEVALRKSRSESDLQLDNHTFDTPLHALEYVDEQIERLCKVGFELKPPTAKSTPIIRPDEQIDFDLMRQPIEPREAHNPELLDAIRADPDHPDLYLVYSDWLQEQGDPRGELITLHHAQMQPGGGTLHRAAQQYIQRFKDQLLPCAEEKTVQLFWYLGFIRGAQVSSDRKETLTALLDHPSAALLQDLAVSSQTFSETISDRTLPSLKCLRLENVSGSQMGRIRKEITAHLPQLTVLSLRGVEELGEVIAPIAASGCIEKLELLDVAFDYLNEDRRWRWFIKKCQSIPADGRPRVCFTQPDEYGEPSVKELEETFVCIEPHQLPRHLGFLGGQRHEPDDLEGELGEDILDHLCAACGSQLEQEEHCPECGCNQYYDDDPYYDFDGGEDNDEVCLHDAGDPVSVETTADENAGVDQHWTAIKEDVFDIDDEYK